MIIQKEDVDSDFVENIKTQCQNIKTWCQNHTLACLITAVVLIISLFFIFGNKEKDEKTAEKEKEKVELESSVKGKKVKPVIDEYKYYHDLLSDDTLSFKSVKEMLVKADGEQLNEKNKPLYDTIYSYAHFVNRYNVTGKPRLKEALKDLFTNVSNGTYTIHRKDSISLVLSTNLTSGEITFFRETHKRNIIELFIGKYNDNNEIQQYSKDEKKERYTRAVEQNNTWKSFSDMN